MIHINHWNRVGNLKNLELAEKIGVKRTELGGLHYL